MNKKPSERIIEICNEPGRDFFQAVLIYLDEEYEKNQPCEHKGEKLESFEEGTRYCGKCGAMYIGEM